MVLLVCTFLLLNYFWFINDFQKLINVLCHCEILYLAFLIFCDVRMFQCENRVNSMDTFCYQCMADELTLQMTEYQEKGIIPLL